MLLNVNMERIEDVEMHATLKFRRVTDEPKAVKSGAGAGPAAAGSEASCVVSQHAVGGVGK